MTGLDWGSTAGWRRRGRARASGGNWGWEGTGKGGPWVMSVSGVHRHTARTVRFVHTHMPTALVRVFEFSFQERARGQGYREDEGRSIVVGVRFFRFFYFDGLGEACT